MGHSKKKKLDVNGIKHKEKSVIKPGYVRKKFKKNNKPGIKVEIPKTSKECGSNWKTLLNEINQTKKEKECHKVIEQAQKKRRVPNKKDATSNGNSSINLSQKDAEIWFDDIPKEEILAAEQDIQRINNSGKPQAFATESVLVKADAFGGLTKAVGIDCEMVGTGFKGSSSILARVSIVNQYGKCIYDKHVKAQGKVTDYRTWVSGIRPSDLKGAEDFGTVQREVAEILKGRVLVGHALHNDLKVLYLSHPRKFIRDTAEYKPFRAHNNGRAPALRILSNKILHVQVQNGEHSSVQDAQVAMKLYMMHKKQWEKELRLARIGNK
ncbi:RNA exonuclease 4-like [Styela clava]